MKGSQPKRITSGVKRGDAPIDCLSSCNLCLAAFVFLCPSATCCTRSLISFSSCSLFLAYLCISWAVYEKQQSQRKQAVFWNNHQSLLNCFSTDMLWYNGALYILHSHEAFCCLCAIQIKLFFFFSFMSFILVVCLLGDFNPPLLSVAVQPSGCAPLCVCGP